MRIAENKKPEVMIAENVPNLLSNKFRHSLKDWLHILREMGYQTKILTLNSQHFSAPPK